MAGNMDSRQPVVPWRWNLWLSSLPRRRRLRQFPLGAYRSNSCCGRAVLDRVSAIALGLCCRCRSRGNRLDRHELSLRERRDRRGPCGRHRGSVRDEPHRRSGAEMPNKCLTAECAEDAENCCKISLRPPRSLRLSNNHYPYSIFSNQFRISISYSLARLSSSSSCLTADSAAPIMPQCYRAVQCCLGTGAVIRSLVCGDCRSSGDRDERVRSL